MIKPFFLYLVSFGGLCLMGYQIQNWVISNNSIPLRFDLQLVYVFFAIASFLLCAVLHVLSFKKKTKDQLGFIYLPSLVIKIALFVIIFNGEIFQLPNITKMESFNLLIPIGLFLVLEVLFIARLLNAKG